MIEIVITYVDLYIYDHVCFENKMQHMGSVNKLNQIAFVTSPNLLHRPEVPED